MVCIYCMHMHKPLHGMSHTIVSKLLINFTTLFESVKIYCPEDAYHQLLWKHSLPNTLDTYYSQAANR